MTEGQTGWCGSQRMERKIKKNKKMNRRAPRVREQKKGVAACPHICQREDGSHIPAKRREMVSGKREKTRRKKNEPKGRGSVSQNVGREEGASKREVREKTRLKACRKRDGAASCRRTRGRLVRGTWGAGVGHNLEFPRITKSTVGTFPNSATFASSHTVLNPLLPPSSDACAFFSHSR